VNSTLKLAALLVLLVAACGLAALLWLRPAESAIPLESGAVSEPAAPDARPAGEAAASDSLSVRAYEKTVTTEADTSCGLRAEDFGGVVVPGLDGIEGKVLGPDGVPVPMPSVWFHADDSNGGGESKPDGSFRVPWCRRGQQADIELGDDASRFVRVHLKAVPGGTRNLVVRLREAKALTLLIRDEHGPVECADVGWRNEFGRGDVLSRSGAVHPDGRFAATAPGNSVRFEVESRGRIRAETGPIDGDSPPAELPLTMKVLPAIRGHVLAGGKPFAGARLRLYPERLGDSSRHRLMYFGEYGLLDTVNSEADGSFQLYEPMDGNLVVVLEAEGYARLRYGPFPYDSQGIRDLVLALDPGGTLEGKVLVPAGRSPERVELRLESGLDCGQEWGYHQRVAADGAFRFEHLRPGSWQLHRMREGKIWTMELEAGHGSAQKTSSGEVVPPSVEVEIASGRTTHADIDLRAAIPCVLELDVTNNSTTAVSWTVSARNSYMQNGGGPYASVGPDGHARLEVEDPGPCSLTFRPNGDYPGFQYSTEITLRRGMNKLRQDIPTASISGTIAGQKTPGGDRWLLKRVERYGTASSETKTQLTPDSQGRFYIRHAKPGPVDLLRSSWTNGQALEELVEHFELVAGGTRTLSLE
jgi:hypothetical protein